MNVDPHELKKFSDAAQRWWQPCAEFKTLHALNPLRLDWIGAHTPLGAKRVLDVGCGGGILSESLAAAGAAVKGIDLSPEVLNAAEYHRLESGVYVEYEAISVESLAQQQPSTYDIVTCMELLEHVPEPASTVAACAALVKPGGWVFFSTLNRCVKAYLLAIIGAEYIAGMLPRGTHDYMRFIRPAELAAMARAAELHPYAFQGIGYRVLRRRFVLTDNVDVNYMLACVRS